MSSSDLSAWGSANDIIAFAKLGDLIEFARVCYRHWGVYVGNGDVIHVFLDCKLQNSAEIKQEALTLVCGGDKCRVNNLADEARKKGLKAFPGEIVVINAKSYIGHETQYGLLSDNCEFFATSCRYGPAFCQQIDSASNWMDVIMIGSAAVAAVAAATKFFLVKKQQNGERVYESGNITRAINGHKS